MLKPEDIQNHLDGLTKPPGSLGRLEQLAARLCEIQQTLAPETQPRELFLFGADHGVVAEGVTTWPSEVTAAMMVNIARGGAASSALCQSTHTKLNVIDVGTYADPIEGVEYLPIRKGSANLAEQPALTVQEFEAAQNIGRQKAKEANTRGSKLILAGEMGIGNTTPSSCLAMLLANLNSETAIGNGAGADDFILKRKQAVVERAVQQAREIWSEDPITAMAAVSGLEIAAISGLYLEAHELKMTILLDGYITSAAALIAFQQNPNVVQSMIASHLSEERGHGTVLNHLGLNPMLDWNLRLGEGTGALLLTTLIDSAAAMVSNMSTLAELGFGSEETTGSQSEETAT